MSCQVEEISPVDILRANWHQFNRNYRETIKYLWALSQKYEHVFVDYDRMAEMCGYCKRTAINICNALSKLGLISWMRRGYRSNLYFLPKELIQFDLRNRSLLKKSSSESCTISCTVLNNIDSRKYVHTGSPSAPVPASPDVPTSSGFKQQEQKKSYESLPKALQIGFMKEFDYKRGSWIVDSLTECQVQEILRDMKWYNRQHQIKSYCGLFVSFALKLIGLKPKMQKKE